MIRPYALSFACPINIIIIIIIINHPSNPNRNYPKRTDVPSLTAPPISARFDQPPATRHENVALGIYPFRPQAPPTDATPREFLPLARQILLWLPPAAKSRPEDSSAVAGAGVKFANEGRITRS